MNLLNAGSDCGAQKEGEVYEKPIAIAFERDDALLLKDAKKGFELYSRRGGLSASGSETTIRRGFEGVFRLFLG